jgi:hypothetical protein
MLHRARRQRPAVRLRLILRRVQDGVTASHHQTDGRTIPRAFTGGCVAVHPMGADRQTIHPPIGDGTRDGAETANRKTSTEIFIPVSAGL